MLPVVDSRKREMVLSFHHSLVDDKLFFCPLHPLEFALCFHLNGTAFSRQRLKIHTENLKSVGYTWNGRLNPCCLNLRDFCDEVNLGLWFIKSQILQGVLMLAHIL